MVKEILLVVGELLRPFIEDCLHVYPLELNPGCFWHRKMPGNIGQRGDIRDRESWKADLIRAHVKFDDL